MTELTIGMPVYNGAGTIRAALDSLLAQSFRDLRVIISDNGSTDGTQGICEAYAARDSRVTYIRQPRNLGPQMNFRFVLFEAQTPYFMWAAADDLWAPTFAERNLTALKADPALVMSQSRVLFTVQGAPSHMATGTFPLMDDARLNAIRFFENPSDNSRYYGVFRTEALKAVFPTRPFFALDWLVSAATLRHGKHNELPDVLMLRDSSDPASYGRAVLSDHRFILWRIFPLLYMTRWLITHRSVPLSKTLLYRLWKANLYLHFRFGVLKFPRLAERYIETNSLVLALGLRRMPAPPSAPPQPSDAGPANMFPSLPEIPAIGPDGPNLPQVAPGEATISLVIVATSSLSDTLGALTSAHSLALASSVEVILAVPRGDAILLESLSPTEGGTIVEGDSNATAGSPVNAGLARAISLLQRLRSTEGVTIVEVDSNATAGSLMNAGLARATAPRVMLVTSEARYSPDIATALEEALEGAPLVAPQLIHADGRLAAAGGVVLAGGALSRHGEFGVPTAPAFQFARSCDFAPAALGLRRDALEEGPLFNEAIRNFDAAVADFCLRQRTKHGAPLYWPWARVTLANGAALASRGSANWGDDLTALRAANGRVLEDLAQLESEGRPAHDRTAQRRLLYVDAITPRPDENAGSIEAISQMTVLRDFGFRITFIPDSNFLRDGRHCEALQKQGIEVIYTPYVTNVRDVLESEPGFDVVFLCRAHIVAKYLTMAREVAPRAKVIFYTVDLHFLREEREARISGDKRQIAAAKTSRLTELASVSDADATIVHSSAEQELLARAAPGATVLLQPLMRAIPAELNAPGPEGRQDIVFVGTYQHPPNVDAATFFAREVWPLVRPRLPGARFLIVGSALTPEVSALAGDGVEVLGFVQDLGPLLDACRVSVAPLRFGAGLKGKVATALQAGLPTVASSVAAEGVALEHGRDILLADTAEDIAEAVVRLYTDDDLWRSLAANGFAFARQEFSFEANAKRIAGLLARLGVSTLRSELVALQDDLASGDPIFRPSKFWTGLASEHLAQLTDTRLLSFKRTINNCYMQWLPGYFDDPRMKLPLAAFHERPSMTPVEVAASAEADPALATEVVGYGGFMPFANPDYLQFYAFYTGLVWHLMTLHSVDGLYTRLEEPKLGRPIPLSTKGQAISQDLAQSLLEYSRVKHFTAPLPLPKRPTYLELGAGYGRLAYAMLSGWPCRYIIVDIPPTILVAKWYLPRVLPHLKVFGYRAFTNFEEVQDEFESADLIFLSPNQLALLPDGFVDVSISISSLHEMSVEQSARYRTLLQAKTTHAIYFKQWIKWRNPADDIEVGAADYQLAAPWKKVLESTDLANHEFIELGWVREGNA